MNNHIEELELHLKMAQLHFDNLKNEIKEALDERDQTITAYVKELEELEEQNMLLEEQVETLNKQNAILSLENIELTLKNNVYEKKLDI